MEKNSKIYVAGHKGLVGSAIVRKLISEGYDNLIFTPHSEYDLRNQQQVYSFFEREKPEYVFLAAAKVGGILANSSYPADFIYDNIMIEMNIIHYSHVFKVKKLLFLGSSCIYPKDCPQPIKEEYLLTGPLEETNEAYALAKISGLKICQYYHQQYGDNFISAMPTNMYGLNDNFNLDTSHVLPAMIRKFYLAKSLENKEYELIKKDLKRNGFSSNDNNLEEICEKGLTLILNRYGIRYDSQTDKVTLSLWGTGQPYREFLFSDDLADALIFLMNHYSDKIHINIGTGSDITIADLAQLIKKISGFSGQIIWDKSKPDGTHRKLLDTARLQETGWYPKVNLEEGIKRVFDTVFKSQEIL